MEDSSSTGCAASRHRRRRWRNELWSLMKAAADYSFNKSHAACYALIAYRTAYLKANYPAEYMAALISSVMSTKDKVPFFVYRCEEMGIEVLPPDVNASGHDFVVVGQHPLRARRGQERRLRGGREDPRGARGGGDVRLDLGLLRAGRRAHGQQEGDREPDQVRRARLDRRDARGHARGAGAGAGRRARRRRRTRARARARSSTSATTAAGAAPRRGGRHYPPIPGEEFERASCCGWRRRRSASSSPPPARGRARPAARPRSTARSPSWPKRQDGAWVTVGGLITRGEADPHRSGGYDDVRDARRPRGQVEMLIFNAA